MVDFKLVFAVMALSICAFAQDEGDIAEGLEAEIPEGLAEAIQEQEFPALEGITTTVVFPHVTDGRFPLGSVHEQLVGIKNGAGAAINITTIQGSFHSPFDFSYHIQNFTTMELGMALAPGESISLLYRYAPYSSLDPMAFHMSTVVYYHTTDKLYSNTVFNQTVEVYEPTSNVDTTKMVSSVVSLVAVVAIIGFLFKATAVEASSKKSGKAAAQREDSWAPPIPGGANRRSGRKK